MKIKGDDGLIGVFLKRKADYFLWLIANLGGLIVSYLAVLTIYFLHFNYDPIFIPGKQIYLINSVIIIAITGVSYLRTNLKDGLGLSPILAYSWPFLIMVIYGLLICLGVKQPVQSDDNIWCAVKIIFTISIFWSSIIWLHEQGRKKDYTDNKKPPEIDPQIEATANQLPKLEGGE